ncbi:hypothetical protein LguiA_033715 [Lonicera macranthoides]
MVATEHLKGREEKVEPIGPIAWYLNASCTVQQPPVQQFTGAAAHRCSRTGVANNGIAAHEDPQATRTRVLATASLEDMEISLETPGIEKIRQAYIEKEDNKKRKQKQCERMQPKMGKMDIDYQVLHDAFFKYQTKLKLTSHGDLYHEGKEFEVKLREMKPGMLLQELKEALRMPESSPPPWLINMQRYGPPHSYPHLKIPGLNAPIPSGAKFGYHSRGWGKPPVDEFGHPARVASVPSAKEEKIAAGQALV